MDKMKIEYGFKDIYGIAWIDDQVDAYNKISARIAELRDCGFTVPEQLLNESHMLYMVPFYGMMREKKQRFIIKMDKKIESLENKGDK